MVLGTTEGCLLNWVFVLNLIKVFILDLNFLVNFSKDLIKVFILDLFKGKSSLKTFTLVKVFILDLNSNILRCLLKLILDLFKV